MKEVILENLTNEGPVNILQVLMNNVVALVAACFIMLAYRITYSTVLYSRKFNVTLGIITITTTMIMGVISNNIALSLGMVGALSIIRFRTAVKDVRDASFIFWAIAVGIGCGVAQYTLVGVGSVFLFVFMILTRQSIASGQQLLVIRSAPSAQNRIESTVSVHFNDKARLTMKNISQDTCEHVYRVRENTLHKADKKNKICISERLMKLEGVTAVNLLEQNMS